MSSDRFLAPAMGLPAIATAAASAPAGAPVVTLDGVTKRFRNGTLALDHFDLTVRAGEFLSLLGPSGCGKSTALRLIAGLGEPTAGRIAWGTDGSGGARKRRRNGLDVGFVFQEPTLMPWATVARNVTLPLELRACRARLRSSAPPRRWSGSASRHSGMPIRANSPAA